MILNTINLRPIQFLKAALGMWLAMAFSLFAYAGDEKSEAYTQAQNLVKSEDYKAAAKVITKAQKNGEDNIAMSLLLTEVYAARVEQVGTLSKLGIAKKIKASMEHSLVLEPDNRSALIGIIRYHMRAPGIAGGSKTEARKHLNKLIDLYPTRGHLMAAEFELGEENFVAMQTHLDTALALDPQNTDVLIGIGTFEMQQKNYAKAIARFQTCLQIENDNIVCRYQLGKSAQVGEIEYEKGKKAFLAIIATPPDNVKYIAYTHYRLGNIYKQEGDNTRAKSHYKLAIKIDSFKDVEKALAELN